MTKEYLIASVTVSRFTRKGITKNKGHYIMGNGKDMLLAIDT